MNEEYKENLEPDFRYQSYDKKDTAIRKFTKYIAWDKYKLKIIDIKISEPIKNEYVQKGSEKKASQATEEAADIDIIIRT